MGSATAELYLAQITKVQRLVICFRPLSRFLHDFAGAPQFAVMQAQVPIRRKFCRGYLSYQARRPH
jgi:hypothetical protein